MINKLPFFKRITFKVFSIIFIVLAGSFFVSYFAALNHTNKIINNFIIKEFNNAINVSENFINFIGQTSQIWAKHTILDNELHENIIKKNREQLTKLMKIEKKAMSADSIILLNEKGFILAQTGSNYTIGSFLGQSDIFKETVKTKSSITKISRERESFIVYSSSVIKKQDKVIGIVLIGYFINDNFVNNMKLNTDLEIAFVGNSAIMSSSKWGDTKELDILPLDYIQYQSLLNNPSNLKTIKYKGNYFIVTAKELKNMESNTAGSILIGYDNHNIASLKENIFIQSIGIFILLFILTFGSLTFFIRKILYSIKKLKRSAQKVAQGDYSNRVDIDSNDELMLLAQSFNQMVQTVEEKNKELEKYNKHLESEIDKRSKELISKEKVLFQQSKMAAMGEMISNIAHQWRQPLSLISMSASGIKLKYEHDMFTEQNFIESMDKITSTTKHLSDTIDDFRNFFKDSKEKVNFKISEVFESCVNMITLDLNNNRIDLIYSSANQADIEVYSYKRELMQSLLNILNNSIDVLKKQNSDKKLIFIDFFQKDEKIIITVKDSGGGIDETIIDKIFEPYFTTKHKSQGTGLGLSMTYQIIHNMGGEITVDNETYKYNDTEYKGAIFKLTIPLILK